MGESPGPAGAVAELAEQPDGLLEAAGGLDVVSELVVGVSQAVPAAGSGLSVCVAQFPVQGDGPLAPGQGLLMVSHLGMAPADVVGGHSFPGLVPENLEQLQG